jgi:hypothetical protein
VLIEYTFDVADRARAALSGWASVLNTVFVAQLVNRSEPMGCDEWTTGPQHQHEGSLSSIAR